MLSKYHTGQSAACYLLVSMVPLCAHASEHHEGINWWHLGSAYKDAPAMGWLIITFLIFVYGVISAIRKPLSLYLETRSKDIRTQIEEAKIAKADSEQKLKTYEEKLRSLDQEIDKMKAQFSEQAFTEKKERDRIAKEQELRIVQESDDMIKASYEREKNRLLEDVVSKALLEAEKLIREEKRDVVDKSLKNAFLKDLSHAKDVRHDV